MLSRSVGSALLTVPASCADKGVAVEDGFGVALDWSLSHAFDGERSTFASGRYSVPKHTAFILPAEPPLSLPDADRCVAFGPIESVTHQRFALLYCICVCPFCRFPFPWRTLGCELSVTANLTRQLEWLLPFIGLVLSVLRSVGGCCCG